MSFLKIFVGVLEGLPAEPERTCLPAMTQTGREGATRCILHWFTRSYWGVRQGDSKPVLDIILVEYIKNLQESLESEFQENWDEPL